MINIKDKCRVCVHRDTCKYSKDYIEFGDRISDLENKLDGNIIAEGVAQIELTCKYYKPITSSIRKSTPMICDHAYEESIKSSFDHNGFGGKYSKFII